MQNKAIDYLDKQLKNGWWLDFDTLAGQSDEWVTAYVAEILAGISNKHANDLAAKAFSKLLRRRPWSAGWGYNKWVPRDADTTIFVVALAEKLGHANHWRIQKAIRFLEKHIDNDTGGMKTFKDQGGIRRFTGLTSSIQFNGWCQAHACVSANALRLKSLVNVHEHLVQFIDSFLKNQHFLEGYWWVHPACPSALLTEATTGLSSKPFNIELIKEWALIQLINSKNNSLFNTACLLIIILSGHFESSYKKHIDAVLSQLSELQNNDGSWLGDSALRIPPPDCKLPSQISSWSYKHRGGKSIRIDQNSNYTTATILKALSLAQTYYENIRLHRFQKSNA